jgi:hypothetical protein
LILIQDEAADDRRALLPLYQRFIQNRTVAVQLKQAIKGLGNTGKLHGDHAIAWSE